MSVSYLYGRRGLLGYVGADWSCRAKPQSLFAKMGGVKKAGVEGLGGKVGGEEEKRGEGA